MALFPVLAFIDRLEKDVNDDEEWGQLSEDHKRQFESFFLPQDDFAMDNDDTFRLNDDFDKKKLWNVCHKNERELIMTNANSNGTLINAVLRSAAWNAANKLERVCEKIIVKFKQHCTDATEQNKDPRAMDLLRFYGTFNARHIRSPPRQSEGAVSDSSDCRSSAVTPVLKADQIHHNMFKGDDSGISCQKFKRFKIGEQIDPHRDLEVLITRLGLDGLRQSLMSVLPDALANLNHARSFLSGCITPLEPLTQTVFVVFLKDLIEKMNQTFPSSSDGSVVVVAGMEPLDVKVTICKEYMRLNAKKRNVTRRATSQETTLRIQSDVAIIKGRSDRYNEDSVGIQQQKMFLDCLVNVEMKRWGLLANRKNKSPTPMTQVAAESMVRHIKRENSSGDWLFSLLTDCMVLYCVCHNASTNEYWISRSVSSPEEILLSICWLYLMSIGMVETSITDWETGEWSDGEVGDDEGIEEEGASSMLESFDESKETNDLNDAHDHTVNPGASNQEYKMTTPAVSFEKMEDDDDEEEERKMWQTFFLMENHRKYGTPLPLTKALLSLHNTQT